MIRLMAINPGRLSFVQPIPKSYINNNISNCQKPIKHSLSKSKNGKAWPSFSDLKRPVRDVLMMPKEKQCQKKRNVRLRDPSRNSNDMNSKHTLFRVEHQIPVTAGRAWLGDFRYGSRKYCLSNVDPQRLKDRQRFFERYFVIAIVNYVKEIF